MSKTILNFWLDVGLLFTFLSLCTVSAILQFVFPMGPAAAGWKLWGLSYVAWRDGQFLILSIFAAEVLLHVMLHWSWICGVVSTRMLGRKLSADDGSRTLWGVALLIALLHLAGGVVAAAYLTIQTPR